MGTLDARLPTQAENDALVGTSGIPSTSNKYVTDIDYRLAFNSSFGDGSDGSVTCDGTTTILGMAPSSNIYTMTRDLYFINLTINTGVILRTAGYRIFGTGTLTQVTTGKFENKGSAGTAGGAGANGVTDGTTAT